MAAGIFFLMTTLLLFSQAAFQAWRPHGCRDLRAAGHTQNGVYLVFDQDQTPYHVYCDFSSELNFVYTLITSWKFSNRMMTPHGTVGYAYDEPVNSFNPNWFSYRMSKKMMQQVRDLPGTTHWRITCGFDTLPGIDYRDYLRFKFTQFDPLSGDIGGCHLADYVNIMGSGCQNCKVFLRQTRQHSLSIEGYSTNAQCNYQFRRTDGKEFHNIYNIFGLVNINSYHPNFRCHSSPNASTGLWFGGKYLDTSQMANEMNHIAVTDPKRRN